MTKSSKKQKSAFLQALLLLALPLGSVAWIQLPIPGTESKLAVMLTELLSIFIFVFLCSQVLNKKKSLKILLPTALERVFATVSVLFFAYMAISTLIRFFTVGFDADFLSYPRICFVLFVVFALLGGDVFSVKQKHTATLALVTVVNAIELFFFIKNGNLRLSAGFVNVNIYACGIIMTVPFLLQLFYSEHSALMRILTGLNLFVCALLIPATGSRLGMFLLLFALVVSVLLHFRSAPAVRVLQSALPVVLAAVCLVGICTVGQNKFVYSSVLRATMLDRYFEIENQDLEFQEVGPDGEMELVSASDTMRSDLWKQAVEEIKEHPVFGMGEMTFNVYVGGRYIDQSAHNFLLEMLMCFGIVGTLLYMTALVCMLLFVLRRCNMQNKKSVLLSLVIFGGFSFMQPTFVSYFLLIWFVLLLTGMMNDKKQKR